MTCPDEKRSKLRIPILSCFLLSPIPAVDVVGSGHEGVGRGGGIRAVADIHESLVVVVCSAHDGDDGSVRPLLLLMRDPSSTMGWTLFEIVIVVVVVVIAVVAVVGVVESLPGCLIYTLP